MFCGGTLSFVHSHCIHIRIHCSLLTADLQAGFQSFDPFRDFFTEITTEKGERVKLTPQRVAFLWIVVLIVVVQRGKGSCPRVKRKTDSDDAADEPEAASLPASETQHPDSMNRSLPADLVAALNREDCSSEFHFADVRVDLTRDEDLEVDDSTREAFALYKHLWLATLGVSSYWHRLYHCFLVLRAYLAYLCFFTAGRSAPRRQCCSILPEHCATPRLPRIGWGLADSQCCVSSVCRFASQLRQRRRSRFCSDCQCGFSSYRYWRCTGTDTYALCGTGADEARPSPQDNGRSPRDQ